MSRRALIEHRPWLLASMSAALLYYLVIDNPLVQIYPLEGIWLILLKGSAVALLAVYAWRRTSGMDGNLLVAVMGLSALANMVFELDYRLSGAIFAAAHLAAIWLYQRNRRAQLTPSQRLTALALVLGTPLISWLVSRDPSVLAYSAILGAMAAMAWTSRFTRYRVGLGAVLFVVSDWLIFSDIGAVAPSFGPALLIWPLYYAGQFMIATGVVQTLRGQLPASRAQ